MRARQCVSVTFDNSAALCGTPAKLITVNPAPPPPLPPPTDFSGKPSSKLLMPLKLQFLCFSENLTDNVWAR